MNYRNSDIEIQIGDIVQVIAADDCATRLIQGDTGRITGLDERGPYVGFSGDRESPNSIGWCVDRFGFMRRDNSPLPRSIRPKAKRIKYAGRTIKNIGILK